MRLPSLWRAALAPAAPPLTARLPAARLPAARLLAALGTGLAAGCDGDAPPAPVEMRVLVVTTPASVAAAGGAAGMATTLRDAFAVANEALSASGVDARWTHAATATLAFAPTDRFGDLRALIDPADGRLDSAHALRERAEADLVVLVPEAPGWTINGAILADASTAFAVVHREDLGLPKYGLAHELAHLLGARHDAGNDPARVPFAFGHGYRDAEVRTILSSGSTLRRVGVFSSPRLRVEGRVVGDDSLRDNARVLRTTAAYVASFRGPAVPTTFVPPGTWPTLAAGKASANACDAYAR